MVALGGTRGQAERSADGIFRAFFEQVGHQRPAVIEAVGSRVRAGEDTLVAFGNPDSGEMRSRPKKRLRGFGVVATPNLLINGRVLTPAPQTSRTYVQALDQALFPQLPSTRSTSLSPSRSFQAQGGRLVGRLAPAALAFRRAGAVTCPDVEASAHGTRAFSAHRPTVTSGHSVFLQLGREREHRES